MKTDHVTFLHHSCCWRKIEEILRILSGHKRSCEKKNLKLLKDFLLQSF